VVRNCVFTSNWGSIAGGVYLRSSSPTFTGCTFYGNTGEDAGGIGLYYAGSSAVVENTILVGSTEGAAIYPDCAQVTLTCCDIFGNAGGDWSGCLAAQNGTNGNFSADPLFCNGSNAVLTLQQCSPCLPGHHPTGYTCGGIIGALGEDCSCGATVQPTTWGALKALYR
jgi:hypothetical protein